MTTEEKAILNSFNNVIPLLTTEDKARLLGFGEGMAFAKQDKEKKSEKED